MRALAKDKARRECDGLVERRRFKNREGTPGRDSLLPRALFVAIRLQTLPAFVLVHLQTTFLFEIAHK
jgi:hypothetical protein